MSSILQFQNKETKEHVSVIHYTSHIQDQTVSDFVNADVNQVEGQGIWFYVRLDWAKKVQFNDYITKDESGNINIVPNKVFVNKYKRLDKRN